jgi:hypothetical protein
MLYRVQFKIAEAPVSSEMIVEASDLMVIRKWCEAVISDLEEAPDSYEISPFKPYNVDQEVKIDKMWQDEGAGG